MQLIGEALKIFTKSRKRISQGFGNRFIHQLKTKTMCLYYHYLQGCILWDTLMPLRNAAKYPIQYRCTGISYPHGTRYHVVPCLRGPFTRVKCPPPPGLSCPREQDTVGTVSCPRGHFTSFI